MGDYIIVEGDRKYRSERQDIFEKAYSKKGSK